MRTWAWVSFLILSVVWGSSFMLIRIGVEEIPPSQLVFIRTLIATIGLNLVMLLRGKRLPTDAATLRTLFIIGFFNGTVPYLLIAIGEQTITSSLASVIQAVVPMFALIIAHFALPDEHITPNKVIGIALGFAGVLILVVRPEDASKQNDIWGAVAIIVASLSYASATVYTRRAVSGRLDPIVIAAGSFLSATFFALVFMWLEPLVGGQAALDIFALETGIWASALMLGFFNTFIAYLFFYYIVQQLGAFRASNVTYVVPVVAILLGWVVLKEVPDARFVLGALLIFAGIAVINVPIRAILRRVRPATT